MKMRSTPTLLIASLLAAGLAFAADSPRISESDLAIKPAIVSPEVAKATESKSAKATPAANFTDLWYNPSESGWGISFNQHPAAAAGRDPQAFAVWYTYDPRRPALDTAEPSDFQSMWFVMPGGVWETSLRFTGKLYATKGTYFGQAWNPSTAEVTEVGTFVFDFTDANNGAFSYVVNPPASAPGSAASGLPAFSGRKAITRLTF